MTTIDNISFNFSVQEESFAHSLYVQWDEYCHRTITTVLDEFFCEVDNKDKWIEIDLLKLELGSIPEEEFYTLFPLRLREALERTFSTYIIDRVDNHKLADSRLDNLLHYLKYGACRAEWSDVAFDLSDELAFIMQYAPSYINIIVQTCFQKAYMLERLMRDVDNRFLMKMIAHWNEDRQITTKERQHTLSQIVLTTPTIVVKLIEMINTDTRLVGLLVIHINDGLESNLSLSEMERSAIKLQLIEHVEEDLRPSLIGEFSNNILWLFSTPMSPFERQRYLAVLLESMPRVVVDFIHIADSIHLDILAEILNSLTIKYIMLTECESHAEVGVPEYWHYFYCWLLEHYPFNGVFSFGDKTHFQKHLNVKLLSFIRKRAYATYLSKAELTIQFLREVFGDEYYIKILNVIYGQQSMAEDGSPEYSGYFNMELYYMFVHLSLLERKVVSKENKIVALVNIDLLEEVFYDKNIEKQIAFLMDSRITTEVKRYQLLSLLKVSATDLYTLLLNVSSKRLFGDIIEVFNREFFVYLTVGFSGSYCSDITVFFQWIVSRYTIFASYSQSREKFTERVVLLLVSWQIDRGVRGDSRSEIAYVFLVELFGAENITHILRIIYSNVMIEISNNSLSDTAHNTDGIFDLVLQIMSGKSLSNRTLERINTVRTKLLSSQIAELLQERKLAHKQDIQTTYFNDDERERTVSPISVEDISGLIYEKDLNEEDFYKKIELLIEYHPKELFSFIENSGICSLQAFDSESKGDVLVLQSCMFEEWDKDLLLDYLKNTSLDIGVKLYALRKYIMFQPIRLLQIIRSWMFDGLFAIEELQEWFELKDWVQMIAGISLPTAELVRQIMWYLQINKLTTQSNIKIGLIRFGLSVEVEKLSKMPLNEIAKLFIRSLKLVETVSIEGDTRLVVPLQDIVLKSVITDLNIGVVNQIDYQEESSELTQHLTVSNAGLALLTPWFPRLFAMLDLLNDEHNDFKDMESRIRAIFIIQRLVSQDDREYKESELIFNRILVGCPLSVPLSKCIELTEGDIETVDGMLMGVKANWSKMENTSIVGFQHSFIERSGVIVQQDGKWVLSVDSRSYDMLLDSLPWSYSRIRFPWLKKPISVLWRSSEKTEL